MSGYNHSKRSQRKETMEQPFAFQILLSVFKFSLHEFLIVKTFIALSIPLNLLLDAIDSQKNSKFLRVIKFKSVKVTQHPNSHNARKQQNELDIKYFLFRS